MINFLGSRTGAASTHGGQLKFRDVPFGSDTGVSERVVNIEDFGGGTSLESNSAVIDSAMPALGAYARPAYRGVLQFGTGNYKMQPPAKAHVRIYTKSSSHWHVPEIDIVGSQGAAFDGTFTKGTDVGGYPAWYDGSGNYLAYNATDGCMCLYTSGGVKLYSAYWRYNSGSAYAIRPWTKGFVHFLYDGQMTVTGATTYSAANKNYVRTADVGGFAYWAADDASGYYITWNSTDSRWAIYNDSNVELYYGDANWVIPNATFTESGADTCLVTNDAIRTEINQEVADEQYGIWHVQQADPTSAEGSDGDIWINSISGYVFTKASGTWSQTTHIIEASETGWSADFWYPVDDEGSDGDYFIQYWIEHSESTRSCVQFSNAVDYTTIRGNGEANTTIQFRCWGDKSADDYEVSTSALAGEQLYVGARVYKQTADGKWYLNKGAGHTAEGIATDDKDAGTAGQIIVRTAIPPCAAFYPDYEISRQRMHRGNLFHLRQNGGAITGLRFENITLDGGHTNTYDENWYTMFDDIARWDIFHKCITCWDGDGELHDCGTYNCTMQNWSGEIIYGGGANDRDFTVDGCTITGCNGSAVSFGGQIVISNTDFSDNYNCTECLGTGTQFMECYSCTFDGSGGGKNGLVWIGDQGTHCTIDGCTFTEFRNASGAAIFFDNACHDLILSDTTIEDCQTCILAKTVSNYSGTITYQEFKDWTIDTVTIRATNYNTSFVYTNESQTYHQLGTWSIDGLVFIEANGNTILKGFNSDNVTGIINVSNSDFAAADTLFDGPSGGLISSTFVDQGGNVGWP